MATTGADGKYAFSGLAPGNYSVSVQAAYYIPQWKSAKVEANKTTTLNFQLARNAASLEILKPQDNETVGDWVEVQVKIETRGMVGSGPLLWEVKEETTVHAADWQGAVIQYEGVISQTSDPNTGTNTVIQRYWWNTLGLHNSEAPDSYKLRVKGKFGNVKDGGEREHTVLDIKVRNLVINLAGLTPELIFFDPASPNVTLTIPLDDSVPAATEVRVDIYRTDRNDLDPPVRALTTTANAPGTATVTWDGRNGEGQVVPWGIYAYEVEATQSGGGPGGMSLDRDQRHSASLWISDVSAEILDESETSGELKLKAGYVLTESETDGNGDPLPASEAKVSVYDYGFQPFAEATTGTTTNRPGETNPVWHYATIQLSDNKVHYPFVVLARDSDAAKEKAHRNKRPLERGKAPVVDFSVEIPKAHDYIVPGSDQNRLLYKIKPCLPGFLVDSILLEVLDKNGAVVFTATDLEASGGDHHYDWEGLDSNGDALTEAEAPYSYRITIVKEDIERSGTLGNRGLIEWGLAVIACDMPLDGSTWESGICEETIADSLPLGTPTGVTIGVQPDGGTRTDIPYYYVISDTGPNGYDADIELRINASGDWHLVYTTPTEDPDLPTIDYTVNIDQVNEEITDVAGNLWDINEETDAREAHALWTFGISPVGDLVRFTETYN
jgi:flagellar hook assembly protein FlgD